MESVCKLLRQPYSAALSQFGRRWATTVVGSVTENARHKSSDTFKQPSTVQRARPVQCWGPFFNFKFGQKSIGWRLAELNEVLEGNQVAASCIHKSHRNWLMSCCEEWTGVRQIGARQPADLHALLRCHALLQLPLSATLRANTRRWLDVRCATLSPAELFPFFGSLSALAVGVGSSLSDHPKPTIESTSTDMVAEVQWLAGVASQARQHFHDASTTVMLRLLGDFARLRVETPHPRLAIVDELMDNLTKRYSQFTPKDRISIVKVMHLIGLNSELWQVWNVKIVRVDRRWSVLSHFDSQLSANGVNHPPSSECLPLKQVVTGLEELEMAVTLKKAQALATSQARPALAWLHNNSAFWPVLLERAKETAQFKRDWTLLQSLIQVLMCAPISLIPQLEALMKIIGMDLKDEIAQVLRFTLFIACAGQSTIVCRWLKRQLCLELFFHEGQLWHPQSHVGFPVDTILRCLKHVSGAVHNERFSCVAPPSAQWLAAFRQRLEDESFKPNMDNWRSIIIVVFGLQAIPDRSQSFILPPLWYTALLDLASIHSSWNDCARPVIGLLAGQHIQFDDAHQTILSSIFKRCCTEELSLEQYMGMCSKGLALDLPIMAKLWQHGHDTGIFCTAKLTSNLLIRAASNFVLGLPSAPPVTVLNSLLLRADDDNDDNPINFESWQTLQVVLGDDFMPPRILALLSSNPFTWNKTELQHVTKNPELEKRLTAEHGSGNVQHIAAIPEITGKIGSYLVTKPDGGQKVFLCDSEKFYNWQIPEERRGGLTIGIRTVIHVMEKAGFQVELVNNTDSV